jgi:hypothetical protein
MKRLVIDHSADVIDLTALPGDTQPPSEPKAGLNRIIVAGVADLEPLAPELLHGIWAQIAPAGEEPGDSLPKSIWDKLSSIYPEPLSNIPPAGVKPERKPRAAKAPKKAKETSEVSSNKDLPAPDSSSTSSVTEGAPPAGTTKEKKMAKAKKATKKAAKKSAKSTTKPGTPREGTMKMKLVQLCQKDGGATMAQMLALTGWQACLGTLKTTATALGLTVKTIKDTEGKKATRWSVSK